MAVSELPGSGGVLRPQVCQKYVSFSLTDYRSATLHPDKAVERGAFECGDRLQPCIFLFVHDQLSHLHSNDFSLPVAVNIADVHTEYSTLKVLASPHVRLPEGAFRGYLDKIGVEVGYLVSRGAQRRKEQFGIAGGQLSASADAVWVFSSGLPKTF